MSVLIETTVGDIVIDLFIKERPRACLNFVKLCKLKYYNMNLFHWIEEGYVAQSGDPSSTGRGGESVFARLYGEQARFFEMEATPVLRHRRRGTVSMANNGDAMHGSQFFVTLADQLDYLDGAHTVFGQVAEGWHTLDALDATICDERRRPYQDVRITHTIVLDDPFDEPRGLTLPRRSPSPDVHLLKSARIGVDELVDPDEGKSQHEIVEQIEEKDAKARSHILEMVGDLHYADEKPPDNVLFICKLNAVTTSEDLEIIFSKFGPIISCEVIKDRKTGQSLQYAFVEFDKPENCETAYFKMDNVLIDDRRIHVDFSQSVSKTNQWQRQWQVHQRQRQLQTKEPPVKVEVKPEPKKERRRSRSPPRRHSREHASSVCPPPRRCRLSERSLQKRRRSRSRSPRRHSHRDRRRTSPSHHRPRRP